VNRREEMLSETNDSRAYFQWRAPLQWKQRMTRIFSAALISAANAGNSRDGGKLSPRASPKHQAAQPKYQIPQRDVWGHVGAITGQPRECLNDWPEDK
jgi:hypothetical protein